MNVNIRSSISTSSIEKFHFFPEWFNKYILIKLHMNDYANIEFWYHFDYCQWQQHSKQTDREYYNGWLMWASFRFQLTFPQICRFHPHSKWQQKKIGKSLTWKYVCIQIYTNGWIIEGIKTRNWMLVKGALWSEEICKRMYDSTIFTYSPLLWKGFTKVKWHPFEHEST